MPNETVVTVRGSATSRHAPELATVSLAVAHEGPDQSEVHRRTVDVANAAVAAVRSLAEGSDAAVTRWSNDRLHTWVDRPWDGHGRQLAPVHHARASLRATFRDVDALGRFLDDVAVRPGVTVDGIGWELTEEHDREFARAARRRAVADAVDRARDYAEAVGFGAVACVAVAHAGLLDPTPATPYAAKAVLLGFAADSAGSTGFSPEDIVVTAAVEARFVAS